MTGCELERERSAIQSPATDESGRDGVPEEMRENDRKIEQTIAFMRKHLHRPLQVAELAALANISSSHFFALFKRRVGCAPIDFFIRLRMHHARWLLDTTLLNVKEVAAAPGYDDPFYFSRIFKSVNGHPPSYYRLRMNGPELAGGSETPLYARAFPSPQSSASKQVGSSAANGDAVHEQHCNSFAPSPEITGKQPEPAKGRKSFGLISQASA